jgi:hypothetical protein
MYFVQAIAIVRLFWILDMAAGKSCRFLLFIVKQIIIFFVLVDIR